MRGVISAMLIGMPLAAASQEMSNYCLANAYESCAIYIEGPIGAGAADRFTKLAEEADGGRVALSGDGGDLAAGLALGRAIRAAGWDTEVGTVVVEDGRAIDYAEGRCTGACAWAYMGGVGRYEAPGLLTFTLPDGPGDFAEGAATSAVLAAYAVEMGVGATLIRRMVTGPFRPDRVAATELGLTTPTGFDAFFLEPYAGGLVAASKRLDPPRPYSHAAQLTAYCREGDPHFLLTSEGIGLDPELEAEVSPEVTVDGQSLPVEGLTLRGGGETSRFEFVLSSEWIDQLTEAEELSVVAGLARVYGGAHAARRELTDMDRDMLDAAFHVCF